MMTEQRPDTGEWTMIAVREGGDVHINHGPAFPCFLTLDWCGCCTCCVCRAFLNLELEDAAWT